MLIVKHTEEAMHWFDFNIDFFGATITTDLTRLSTASLSPQEVDGQVAALKADLDRVAAKMKTAIAKQSKQSLFGGDEDEPMTTMHLVDPELLPLLEVFPVIDVSPAGLDAARAVAVAMEPEEMGAADGLQVAIEERMIGGPQGPDSLRILILRPTGFSTVRRGAILHVHGGGYVIGRPELSLAFLRATVAVQGCIVVTVDYRLAPEATWEGATEDGYAALTWLAGNAGSLGVDESRIGIMGESAGGGLAAAIALIARDRKGPVLAFQNLLYPMLDDRTVTRADQNPVTGEFIWTRTHNHHGWTAYLGHTPGADAVSHYAAPARATELAGLPPTWIGVGGLDLFLDEDTDYALRLNAAGVPVDFVIYPGAYHAFEQSPEGAISARANADRQAALHRALAV